MWTSVDLFIAALGASSTLAQPEGWSSQRASHNATALIEAYSPQSGTFESVTQGRWHIVDCRNQHWRIDQAAEMQRMISNINDFINATLLRDIGRGEGSSLFGQFFKTDANSPRVAAMFDQILNPADFTLFGTKIPPTVACVPYWKSENEHAQFLQKVCNHYSPVNYIDVLGTNLIALCPDFFRNRRRPPKTCRGGPSALFTNQFSELIGTMLRLYSHTERSTYFMQGKMLDEAEEERSLGGVLQMPEFLSIRNKMVRFEWLKSPGKANRSLELFVLCRRQVREL